MGVAGSAPATMASERDGAPLSALSVMLPAVAAAACRRGRQGGRVVHSSRLFVRGPSHPHDCFWLCHRDGGKPAASVRHAF